MLRHSKRSAVNHHTVMHHNSSTDEYLDKQAQLEFVRTSDLSPRLANVRLALEPRDRRKTLRDIYLH